MKKRIIIISIIITLTLVIPVTYNLSPRLEILPKKHSPTKATMEEKKVNKIMAMEYARVGWGWNKTQQACVFKIFMKESKFDHRAKNQQGSSAFGIAQMLGEKSKDPNS